MDLADNPFQPGAGRLPPLRAGHKEAATYLADRLEDIRDTDGGDMVILCGPRGNGKTALLGELHEKAKTAGVRVIALRPSEMAGDSVTLAGMLAAETAGIWPRIKGAGTSLLDAGARMAPGRSPGISAKNALRRHLRGPLLLIVDEAHEMPVGLGRNLLEAAQGCISRRLPLLVALAGTPGLPAHLMEMRAGFCERCTEFRIGRIETDEAVREALAKPAKDSGMPIDTDALESLVEESQRYPFFVQKLGFESWNAAHTRGGSRRITTEDAHKGIAATKEQLPKFYNTRRNEMYEHGVLGEAEAVSKVVFERGRDALLTQEELMTAVKGAATDGAQDPRKVVRRLAHLGLVWETPGLDWEPGIPSLCRFLVEQEGRDVAE